MKRIILCLCLFIFIRTEAQQINPVPDYVFSNKMSVGRNAVTDTAAYFSIGPRYGAIRGMMPPMVTDTASMSATKRNGLLIFSIQKNKYLYWDSVGAKWAEMAGTAGSAITGSGVAGYMPEFTTSTNLDTTRLYHSAGRFGIGTTSPLTGLHVNDEVMASKLVVDTIGGLAYNSPWRALGVRTNFTGVTHWWGRTNVAPVYTTGGLDFTFFKSRFGDSAMRDGDELWYAAYYAKHRNNDNNWASNDSSYVGAYVVNSRLHPNNLRTSQHQFRFKNSSGVMTNALTIDGVDNNVTVNQSLKISTIDSSASPINYLWADATGVVRKAPLPTATISGSGTTNYVTKFTGSTSVGSSQIFDNGTNVGIGNATPAYKLDITGQLRISNYLYTSNNKILLGQDGTGGINMYLGDLGNDITGSRLFVYAQDYIDLRNNGASTMRLFSNGNIGVGTTTDAGYKLNVVGSFRTSADAAFATSSGSVGIGTESPVSKLNVITTKTATLSTAADFLTLGATIDDNNAYNTANIGGGIAFRARRNISGTLTIYGAIDAAKENTANDDYRGMLRFYTNNNSTAIPTENMRITSAGEVLIGTTTDAGAYALQVAGAIYNTTTITTGAPTGGSIKPWRLGEAATVSPTSPNRTIRVEIDGTVYFIHAKTTND